MNRKENSNGDHRNFPNPPNFPQVIAVSYFTSMSIGIKSGKPIGNRFESDCRWKSGWTKAILDRLVPLQVRRIVKSAFTRARIQKSFLLGQLLKTDRTSFFQLGVSPNSSRSSAGIQAKLSHGYYGENFTSNLFPREKAAMCTSVCFRSRAFTLISISRSVIFDFIYADQRIIRQKALSDIKTTLSIIWLMSLRPHWLPWAGCGKLYRAIPNSPPMTI